MPQRNVRAYNVMVHTPFLYLTTTGRRTGLPREIEIWFTELAGRYYVIAEYEDSQWVQNLKSNPRVRWRVSGQEVQGKARIVDSQLEPKLCGEISKLSQEKHGWSDGLVVELSPDTLEWPVSH